MARTVRIKLDHAGMAALLRDPALVDDLAARAQRIAAAAGEGFKSEARAGRRRALAMVWPDTAEAVRAELERRALTSAIDAGR
jgi:hypothetical protein